MTYRRKGHNPSNITPMRPVGLTHILVTNPTPNGKVFELSPDGTLIKSGGTMIYRGEAEVVQVTGLQDFAEMRADLDPGASVLVHAVPSTPTPERGWWDVVKKDELARMSAEEAAVSIARAKSCFHRPPGSPCVWPVDYDPADGAQALTPEELLAKLVEACPPLGKVQMLVCSSSGGYVYRSDTGEELRGQRGLRLYMIAEDGADIERAAMALYHRLWLAGHGYIVISASGSRNPYSLMDRFMAAPERVDYAARAVLSEGLEQRWPEPRILNPHGHARFDTRLVTISDAEEQAALAKIEQAKAAVSAEAAAAQAVWLERHGPIMARARLKVRGVAEPTEEQVDACVQEMAATVLRLPRQMSRAVANAERGEVIELPLDWVVYLGRDRPMAVREIVEKPKDFDGVPWCDPLEAHYNDWHCTGAVFGSRGEGYSHAHGPMKTYRLGTKADRVALRQEKHARVLAHAEAVLTKIEKASTTLDEETVEALAIFGKAGDKAAVERIEAAAKEKGEGRSKGERTELLKRVKAFIRQAQAEESEAASEVAREELSERLADRGGSGSGGSGGSGGSSGATGGFSGGDDGFRPEVRVDNPDRYGEQAEELARVVGQRELAFYMGGHPVVCSSGISSTLRTYVRDEHGNKMIDEHGDPVMAFANAASARPLNGPQMTRISNRVARFRRANEEQRLVPTTISPALKGGLEAELEIGTGLKALVGVSRSPIWHGVRLVTGCGYHEPSGVWLDTRELTIEPFESAQEAMKFLCEDWLRDFCFVAPVALAGAICAGLSMLVAKSALAYSPGPPIFMFTAPSAGLGKTLLVDALHMAVSGEPVSVSEWPGEREEQRKLLAALVLGGGAAVLFDNMQSGSIIGNSYSSLAAVATAERIEGRILGKTALFKAPAALTICMTGNNIQPAGDMASRTIEVRLRWDEGQENIADRQFRHEDLLGWTREHRGVILGAMQAVLRHRPAIVGKGIGRFREWARIVAAPVIDLVRGVDENSFYAPIREASELDQEGTSTAKGISRVLAEIAAIPVVEMRGWTGDELSAYRPAGKDEEGGEQARLGVWMTAGEIIRALHAEVWRNTHLHGDVNELNVGLLLGGHHDQKIDGLILRDDRVNLGNVRTNSKRRRVFRIERPEGYDASDAAAHAVGASLGRVVEFVKRD